MEIINHEPHERHEPELRYPNLKSRNYMIAVKSFLCLRRIIQTTSLSWFVLFMTNLFLFSSCANPFVAQIIEPKTISFETNGGSKIDEQIVYRNYPIQRPANPSKDNYLFDNWYIENEDFETPWDFKTIPTSDLTLYANWTTIHTYTVTFDKNGGDTDADPQSMNVTHGALISEPSHPAKDGYGFAGWYTEAECITKWDFANNIVTEDITLYAFWIHNDVTITLIDIDNIPAALGVTFTPAVTPAITLSRSGAGGNPSTQNITVTGLNAGDSFGWSIKGAGVYASETVQGMTSTINLDANNVLYNSLGWHTVELNIKKDGIDYRTNFVFQIIQ